MIILTDIHGNFLTMLALLAKIPLEEKQKGIVVAGDLIDRGPCSRQVVQFMIDNNIPCVPGNHEKMMGDEQAIWLMNGGYQTLESYNAAVVQTDYDKCSIYFPDEEDQKVYQAHQKWMKELPLYLEFPDIKKDNRHLVISHSSINSVWKHRNNINQKNNFEMNVLWGRPATIQDVPEIYNVFGHTPCENGPKIKVPFANIDTGCFYKQPGYGVLTALQFPEMIIYSQENID